MDIFLSVSIMESEASNNRKEPVTIKTFCKNLKRFRITKNMTQEQAAEALGVRAQTVSRWECSTTLPDVAILPKIAALYGVTVDDLYRENGTAYDNYAQRLGSVFEASRKAEDFFPAYTEYRKLFRSGAYTPEDLRLFAILNQYMMQICTDTAEAVFNRIIKKGPAGDPVAYWSACRQKCYFLWETGRNRVTIDSLLPRIEAGSSELQEWICLIQAYTLDKEYEAAWKLVEAANSRFCEDPMLHIYTGDLLRSMKRYEEAFSHWRRALEMEPEWCDAAYSMASCYEEIGDYENACAVYTQLAEALEKRGFDSEENLPRSLAEKCRRKVSP